MEQRLLEKMYERLGCRGCRFANKEVLSNDGCCKYPNGQIEVDDDGKCKMREDDANGQ